jgi:hypothetical protein
VTWPAPDKLHRTVKILIDTGRAAGPDEARRFLESRILQVAVGPGLASDPAGQAALLTIINAGRRAFLGGVHVRFADGDAGMSTGWANGRTAGDAATCFGGEVVGKLTDARPTLTIGSAPDVIGSAVLHLTYSGWVGGIVEDAGNRLDGPGMTLAGIAAGALGISELFQHELGAALPAHRDVGISLWRPDLGWRHPAAIGPVLAYTPTSLWLLGLGHLGQAYAWSLGLLPYSEPADVHLALVDFDDVAEANVATQLLTGRDDVGRPKARIVARALEGRGFRTTIVERAFDEHFYPDLARGEPSIALVGFDRREPRLHLGGDRFSRVVDAGLGPGPWDYLDLVIHTFPAEEPPDQAFAGPAPITKPLPAAYQGEIDRQTRAGAEESAARCGMLDIARVSIGAAFVGAFTSTLAIADILRLLHGGPEIAVLALDLRDPEGVRTVLSGTKINAAPPFATVGAQERDRLVEPPHPQLRP